MLFKYITVYWTFLAHHGFWDLQKWGRCHRKCRCNRCNQWWRQILRQRRDRQSFFTSWRSGFSAPPWQPSRFRNSSHPHFFTRCPPPRQPTWAPMGTSSRSTQRTRKSSGAKWSSQAMIMCSSTWPSQIARRLLTFLKIKQSHTTGCISYVSLLPGPEQFLPLPNALLVARTFFMPTCPILKISLKTSPHHPWASHGLCLFVHGWRWSVTCCPSFDQYEDEVHRSQCPRQPRACCLFQARVLYCLLPCLAHNQEPPHHDKLLSLSCSQERICLQMQQDGWHHLQGIHPPQDDLHCC